jgi:hypothetical protein
VIWFLVAVMEQIELRQARARIDMAEQVVEVVWSEAAGVDSIADQVEQGDLGIVEEEEEGIERIVWAEEGRRQEQE